MYYKLEDFLSDWRFEEKLTLKVFSKVNNSLKAKKLHESLRSLERLAWHITCTLTEMPAQANIIKEDYLHNLPIPIRFSHIIDSYKNHSLDLTRSLETSWAGTDLSEPISIYGQKWKKSKLLTVLVKHQIHHRAQMTVLMRMMGMPVPGTYGPSIEEWSELGSPAPV